MSSSGVLLFTVLLMGYLYWSIAQPTNTLQIRCQILSTTPPVEEPHKCPFGFYINHCKRLACKQGPGAPCGNEHDLEMAIKYGECADGLECCNSKCLGCFQDNCIGEPCNPSYTRTFRHHSYVEPSEPVQSFYPRYVLGYFRQ